MRARRSGAGQDAQRVGHLNGGHGGDDHVQHAGGFAGGLRARRRVGIDAAQARGAAGNHRHGESVAGHGGAVDPRNAAAHGEIVDQVARLEIVGAVQDDVGVAQQFGRVGGGEIGDDAAHADGGIDARDAARGGGGFGQRLGGVGLFEKPLAMQVAGLDVIAIDQGEPAHTGARQRGGVKAAQRAASGDDRVRLPAALPARVPRFRGIGFAASSARDREGSMHCDGNRAGADHRAYDPYLRQYGDNGRSKLRNPMAYKRHQL